MEALYLLIPLSLAFIAVAAWLFLRMSDSGQFDDLDSPAWSILHDDDRPVDAPRDDAAAGGREEGGQEDELNGEQKGEHRPDQARPPNRAGLT